MKRLLILLLLLSNTVFGQTQPSWYQLKDTPINTVAQFGAKGDGSTDDTVAIQSAIDAGKPVFIPAGTYMVGTLVLASNTHIMGVRGLTILKTNTPSTYMLTADSDSASVADNVVDITLRDLTFDFSGHTFAEGVHCMTLNGVSKAIIDGCTFYGFRGDGIYLGSGNTAGLERHNENVTITNCVFDGINNENRNGISVIDCDGLHVNNNMFEDVSKSTMPGGIDIEPNASINVLKSLSITNNIFVDTSDAIVLANFFVSSINSLVISGNTGLDGAVNITCESYGSGSIQLCIIENNTFEAAELISCSNTIFKNNTINSTISYSQFGRTQGSTNATPTYNLVENTIVKDNIFISSASQDQALIIGNSDNLIVTNNQFFSTNAKTNGIIISGAVGDASVISNLTLTYNDFTGDNSTNNINYGGTTFVDPLKCIVHGNRISTFIDPDLRTLSSGTQLLPSAFYQYSPQRWIINGDPSAPDVGKQGILETKYSIATDSFRKFIRQIYYPAGRVASQPCYTRCADSTSDAWQSWSNFGE